jgi:superfamily II DNA or RNA helicase
MKLNDFLFKHKNKINDLGKAFIINVYYKDFGEKGLDYITPEYEISKPDGSGVYRIDFVIKTKFKKYAIECDGLYYHAQGAVTKEYFNHLQNKQNEIIKEGFHLIRFTNDLIRKEPQSCIWEIRRSFIGDEQLYKIYLNRLGDVEPHYIQNRALEALDETRKSGKNKGLVVFATGLGKTYLSAFDVKQFNPKRALFIVHINEILKQSLNSFQDVLPKRIMDMGYYIGTNKEDNKNILFASIQTLSRLKNLKKFKEDEFDYIIVDETHHTAAPTYKKIFSYFKPRFILGLTATPERMDRKDILPFYDNNVVFRIDQKEAIEMGYLVPFHYYGFKDNIDYSKIYFNGFRYDVNDLNKLLMIKNRDKAIIGKFKKMASDRKTIGFCVSIEHADWCAKSFQDAGIRAVSIHSKLDDSEKGFDVTKRDRLINGFRNNEYQVVFVVNMFNEGVDFPDVECLLFLRPTESKTIFIQHMGRGLRLSPGKENVLILDFIGNYKTAGMVLSGLGLNNGTGDLKKIKKNKKELFHYDNNGCLVEFEEEVVDVFKKLEANASKKVRKELISEEWIHYANYLYDWTKENLYWKVGQQNRYFEVQFEALSIIKSNPNINEKEFIRKIQEVVNSKYPKKNMTAGFRALFLSKISGYVSNKTPLSITDPFMLLYKEVKDFSDINKYKDLLTSQIEKIFYWNSIYGSYNKYIKKEHRVSFKDFKIYPFYFIYDLLLRLVDNYGFENYEISSLEFNSFVAVTKNHFEIEQVIDRIVDYRNYEHKYELEKLLKKKNNIDPRFFRILHYNKYLIVNENYIKINDDYINELRKKVEMFRVLLESNELILFNEEDSEEYFDFLYSDKDFFVYHKNK